MEMMFSMLETIFQGLLIHIHYGSNSMSMEFRVEIYLAANFNCRTNTREHIHMVLLHFLLSLLLLFTT